MSSFSAQWLSLREPADARARSRRLTRTLADTLTNRQPLRVLDLASGTGSNTRYLAGYFRGAQDWLLVDHDAALLESAKLDAPGRTAIPSFTMATRVVDLVDLDHLDHLFVDRDLVTASALLDLVSEEWLLRLLTQCRTAGAAVLFALSYDGRIECAPDDPDDERVRDLVNRHQTGDKGFGGALGPRASARVATVLAGLGYEVSRAQSDWMLAPESHELQSRLIQGWAEAATDTAPLEADVIAAWRDRRLAHVLARRSHLVVGHEDVAARHSD